jgi:hypothetical protein
MKLRERYLKFVNNVNMTLSNGKMTKIQIVDLVELYTFDVHDFFDWIHFINQNFV